MQATQTRQMIWRQIQPVRSVDLSLPVNVLESGVRFRTKRQMPILADGDVSVRNIVGSVRNLKIQAGMIHGDVRWGSDTAAQALKSKLESGVLRLRLDIVELEVTNLRNGQSLGGINGPGQVVSKWMPVSATLEASK